MKVSRLFFVVLFLIVVVSAVPLCLSGDNGGPASRILHHGKIFTGDPCNQWAEALAIRNRFIVRVGNNEEVMRFAGPHTEMIDLQGKLVIPGLNDAHMHILPLNTNGPLLVPPDAMLGPGPSFPDFLGIVQQAVLTYPAGTWLYAPIGWSVFDDPQANRTILDEIAPDHPLVMQYMHVIIANTAALQAAGITDTEPDPFGGVYERFPGTNIINGRLHEYATYNFIRKVVALVPDSVLRQLYQDYIDGAVTLGITSVQDIPIHLSCARAVEIVAGANLKIRVREINTPMTLAEADQFPPGYLWQPFWAKLTVSGVKWFNDGTVIERDGAVTFPYLDQPGYYGLFNFPLDVYDGIVAEGLRFPASIHQLLFHTFGDRAVDNLLNAMTHAGADWRWQGHRLQLIHGDMIREDQIPLIKNKGAVVVQNPTHFAVPHLMLLRYGPERMATLQPIKTLVDNGIPLALGSDGIGDIISPFVDIMFAVTHPTRPSEALTLEQAIMAYTSGSAYAEFKEHVKGTLKPGMLADLAVLSQDLFSIMPDQYPATFSLLTIVDGEIVHNAGVL